VEPILVALVVFGVSYIGLLGVEKAIHRLTHNPDQSYRLGVWTFAILLALYAYTTSLGR
jgi:uncharacterized BrkB/YihY/UPF0761 family membrane protein